MRRTSEHPNARKVARYADFPDAMTTFTSTLPRARKASDAFTADWADFRRLIESCTQFSQGQSMTAMVVGTPAEALKKSWKFWL